MLEISIIIPVYNCALFLEECIESIQRQDVDLEIICIDDSSVDGSQELLEKMSKKDRRIRWYGQDHAGAAAARNLGINMAAGEYIAFIDADDYYLDEHALKVMLQKCRDYGVNACGSVMSLFEKMTVKEAANYQSVQKMAQQGIIQYKDYQVDYDFTTFVFKRSVIINNHIYFPHYGYYEDPPFLVKALFAVQKFVMSDIRLYCYRIRHGNRLRADQCLDVLDGIRENILFALQNKLNELFAKTLLRLEYEFGDVILYNLRIGNIEILEKLVEMNTIVCDYYGKYIIRPLSKLLDRNQFFEKNYEQYLKSILDQYTSIYIYGAGITGKKFERYLSCLGMNSKVKGFIITDIAQSRKMEINEKRIFRFQDILQYLKGSYIFVAVGSVYIAEIVQMLQLAEVKNYEIIDAVFLESI